MSPQISIGSSFSETSISQINEHLFYFGNCLDLVSQETLLASADLSISLRRGRNTIRVEGILRSSSGAPISGEAVKVFVGGRIRRVVTDQGGRYSLSVRSAKVRRGSFSYSTSEGGEVRSQRIKVR